LTLKRRGDLLKIAKLDTMKRQVVIAVVVFSAIFVGVLKEGLASNPAFRLAILAVLSLASGVACLVSSAILRTPLLPSTT
jgi:hypothetical protein